MTQHRSVEEFLAYAIRLEADAADRFGQLAHAMRACGNTEVAQLFGRLSDYSRMHLADAQARAGFRDIPDLKPTDFVWPDLESPETAAIWAADPFIGREEALTVALDAERSSYDYYKAVLDTTTDPEIRMLAAEFVKEEAEHVAELEKWVAAHQAKAAWPAVP